MKKQLLSLLILPALMLTSCNKGKEIKKEEAEKLAQEISDKSNDELASSENLEFKLSMIENTGKGEDKESTSVEYVYKMNEDSDIYFQMKGESEDGYFDFTLINVYDEEYGEVTYLKTYDPEEKTTTQYSIPGEVNILYENLFVVYKLQLSIAVMLYLSYTDPFEAMSVCEYDEEDEDIKGSTKYYSTGEGNLTAEISTKYVGEIDKDEEDVTSASLSVTYDNYLLTNFSLVAKSSFGNTCSLKISASHPKEKIKISLPNNWKDFFID